MVSSGFGIARVDDVALRNLNSDSLLRYTNYKDSLLAEGQPEDVVAATLSILVWELSTDEPMIDRDM